MLGFVLGFVLVLAWGITAGVRRWPENFFARWGTVCASAVLIVTGMVATHQRVKVWKDNETLFVHDVARSPNSASANLHAASVYMRRYLEETWDEEAFTKCVTHLERCLEITPGFPGAKADLVTAYTFHDDFEKAYLLYLDLRKEEPTHASLPQLSQALSERLFREAIEEQQQGDVKMALAHCQRALVIRPQYKAAKILLGRLRST